MYYIIWTDADAEADKKLRNLVLIAKYPYVRRKLNNARWYLIETHTRQIEEAGWQGQAFVINSEVPHADEGRCGC